MEYELIAIGSGPAGEKGAAQVAYFGKSVAMIEAAPELGGAAANTGTLPSKTLRETALMLSGFRARGLYGVDLSIRREITVRDFLHREREVTNLAQRRVHLNVDRHYIQLIHGFAAFVDPHTVEVVAANGQRSRIRGQKILIATGSSPYRPHFFDFSHPRIYDSDDIVSIDEMPQHLAIVGGGVIACEYACMFAALGVKVTLIHGNYTLLSFLDDDVVSVLVRRMASLGIEFILNDSVETVRPWADRVDLQLKSGRQLSASALLVAMGRYANTQKLNLEAAGIHVGQRGCIKVDKHYRTCVEHIYAAGDVIGFPALASTAMEQARIAMRHAFGLGYKTNEAPVLPFGLYTIPEVSVAGASEKELQAQGIDYVVGKAFYRENPRGLIIGDEDGFLKLLVDRQSHKLLGVHIVGEQASELIHAGVAAMMYDSDMELFLRMCFNYPTLGDLYKYAAYDALGQLNGHPLPS